MTLGEKKRLEWKSHGRTIGRVSVKLRLGEKKRLEWKALGRAIGRV